MDAAERKEILSRYMDHQRRFEAVAARRQNGQAEVIPFTGPLREQGYQAKRRQSRDRRPKPKPREHKAAGKSECQHA